MYKLFLSTLIILLGLHSIWADDLAGITYCTEEFPPYNYVEGGELKGIAVDILHAAAKEIGSSAKVSKDNVMVWSVAYYKTKYTKNSCLFSTNRTENREPHFSWVGPIAKTTVAIIAPKKSAIKISSVEDLKKYSIGVIRDDIAHQLLVDAGVTQKLQLTSDNSGNIDKLSKNYIELWAYESSCAFWQLKQAGKNIDEYEVVHVLKESELYFSFNKESDAKAVAALQRGIDAIRKSGVLQAIVAQYTK